MKWILVVMVLAMFAVAMSGCPDLRPYRATVSDVPAEDCGCRKKNDKLGRHHTRHPRRLRRHRDIHSVRRGGGVVQNQGAEVVLI